jgi:GntR family transcriptional regulator/MocR family aminotransferase
VLSAARRAALLEFARRHAAVVVEDDYDGEFRFGGRPLDALRTLAGGDEVFFVGTFSKNLFPALRLGYVVAPPWALAALAAAKERADWHCNLLAQGTLAAFVAEGHLARHVRRMRALYAARRERLVARLRSDFAPWLAPVDGEAGLHVAATGRRAHDFAAIAARARAAGVGVSPLRDYGLRPAAPHGLVFGYGAIDEAAIGRGLDALLRVMP